MIKKSKSASLTQTRIARDPQKLVLESCRMRATSDRNCRIFYDIYENGFDYKKLSDCSDAFSMASAKFLRYALIPSLQTSLRLGDFDRFMLIEILDALNPVQKLETYKKRWDEFQRILSPNEKKEIYALLLQLVEVDVLVDLMSQDDAEATLNFWKHQAQMAADPVVRSKKPTRRNHL